MKIKVGDYVMITKVDWIYSSHVGKVCEVREVLARHAKIAVPISENAVALEMVPLSELRVLDAIERLSLIHGQKPGARS